jgi:hypothetical protein
MTESAEVQGFPAAEVNALAQARTIRVLLSSAADGLTTARRGNDGNGARELAGTAIGSI